MRVNLSDLVDSEQAAAHLGLAQRESLTVYRRRYDDFPEPVLESAAGRCMFWLRPELSRWAERRSHAPITRHTKATLVAMVPHVRYEWISSIRAAQDALTHRGTIEGQHALEAALVHGRNLHEFFGTQTTHRDDVQAVDYLPGWKAKPFLRPAELKVVHRNLAHISTARIDKPAWNVDELVDRTMVWFGAFLEELSGHDQLMVDLFNAPPAVG